MNNLNAYRTTCNTPWHMCLGLATSSVMCNTWQHWTYTWS